MSFIARRQLSTLIPPKIASAKVCKIFDSSVDSLRIFKQKEGIEFEVITGILN